jgi:hypothetical protein
LHAAVDSFARGINSYKLNIDASLMYIKTLNDTMSVFKDRLALAEREVNFYTSLLALYPDETMNCDNLESAITTDLVSNRLLILDLEMELIRASFDAKKSFIPIHEDNRTEEMRSLEELQGKLRTYVGEGYSMLNDSLESRNRYLCDVNSIIAKRVAEGQIGLYKEHIERFANLISEENELVEKYYEKCSQANLHLSMFKKAIDDCEHIK